VLALEAAGRIGSIEEFTVAVETVFEPNESHYEIYQNGLERQQRLYEKLIT